MSSSHVLQIRHCVVASAYTVKPNKLRILKTFVETDYHKVFKLTNLILLSK